MPTYVYRREDGTTFETRQQITDEALDTCPETGQPVERIIAGSPGIIMDSSSSGGSEDSGSSNPSGPSCCGPMCGL